MPNQNTDQAAAKLKHVEACLVPESQYEKSTGLEMVELNHQAAGGLSLHEVKLSTTFLGRTIQAPLMIAPMTGGTELGALLNQRWARAAEHFGLPMGVGSQRLALFDDTVRQSFMVRRWAKTTMVFANLGAAQLMGEDACALAMRAVDMIEADALFIHINPLQEACQKNGDTNWVGMLTAIERVVATLKQHGVPVLAREVGFGISQKAALALINTGIAGLDCAGAGGTSWAKVEGLCAGDERSKRLGQVFGEWGIKTAQSITNVRTVNRTIPLIATGGIRTGLEVAKCLALGADMAAMARPMLIKALEGEEALHVFIEQVLLELKVSLFAAGAGNVPDIKSVQISI